MDALLPEQIEAANRLCARMEQWKLSDAALDDLASRLPRFDERSTLLKAVTVNSLYGTNVYVIIPMAAHVAAVLADTDLATAGPELVERLARIPAAAGAKPRRYHSFASKFAHFFIDPERFPILDRYAEAMVRHHLGTAAVADADHRCVAFVRNFDALRAQVGWTGENRAVDRYLWLAGVYREWRRNRHAPINREARELFRGPAERAEDDLKVLLGAAPD